MNTETTKCCGAVEHTDEAHCDEHLAARDLLESAKEMLRWIGGLETSCESSAPGIDWREMMDRARAAIAKAEGK
jgi:hypothetical protein